MAESQQHGFVYENFIRENIHAVHSKLAPKISYTSKWDIPPISIKSFKFSSNTIELGSIERMFMVDYDFSFALVGYAQKGTNKEAVYSDVIYVSRDVWKTIKGQLNNDILQELTSTLTSFKEGEHVKAREWAKNKKKELNDQTLLDIRFKIDSKTQRRIQCAIKLDDLLRLTKTEFVKENQLLVPSISSATRTRATSTTVA